MQYEELLNLPPYSLSKNEKTKVLTDRIQALTRHHAASCKEYRHILDIIDFHPDQAQSYEDYPFLPVRFFKEMDLKSVPDEEITRTITSSGTSGQSVSKIYLDKSTSANQRKVMAKIVSDYTGQNRMPMIIIDSASVLKNRKQFSARGAGILGFSVFGTKKIYALDEDMRLDEDGLRAFLDQCKGQRILLFGFTFIIWQHFYQELLRLQEKGIRFDLSNGILIHGGGWKKLQNEAVSEEEFHQSLHAACGISSIHDYYGMAEQLGSIYVECEHGHMHCSNYSDVIIRNPKDFSVCGIGEKGLMEVVSVLPASYPGHVLLTEDVGEILGEDDCPCGRCGKYFKIHGRIKNAEVRGCSDTYEGA